MRSLDAGGGGDCLFHSIAAIVEAIILDVSESTHRFEPYLEVADFFRGKQFVANKLRAIVAAELVNMQPEAFLNIILSSWNHERCGGWADAWSPGQELGRAGFDFLVRGRANAVEAIGENEDAAPGDMLV